MEYFYAACHNKKLKKPSKKCMLVFVELIRLVQSSTIR